jgi:hypothetical protein
MTGAWATAANLWLLWPALAVIAWVGVWLIERRLP